jgi:hypothetical protein
MIRSRVALAAAVGVLGGAAVVATPAAAAGLTGLEVVWETSGTSSMADRSIDVDCPREKVVLSGGGYLAGDAGVSNAVHLDGFWPYAIGTGAIRATASEWGGGFAGNWSLLGYALCADRPDGYEIQSGYSSPGSNWVQGATAYCSPGKKVVGFGGQATTVPGFDVALTAIIPAAKLDRVIMQAFEEEGGENDTWEAVAFAVCADARVAALTLKPETTVNAPSDWKAIGSSSACGTATMHGFGFGVFGGNGEIFLSAAYPGPDLTAGFAFAAVDATGYANPWYMTGHSLCG